MPFREVQKLDEFMDGAVNERFEQALHSALANCLDPNTDPKKARKVTLTFDLIPNPARDAAAIKYDVKVALAPPVPIVQTVFLSVDGNGQIMAVERTDQVPGQVSMEGKVAPDQKMIKFEAPASGQK